VNQALARLLRGNNTTISIAHRLSTIQRADAIICIGADGRVTQVGTYAQLAADRDGAFAKLMEWQMQCGGIVGDGGRRGEVAEGEEGLAEEEGLTEEEVLTEEERRRGGFEGGDGR